MNNNNLINAIQMLTGIAVVIGLVMVFIELRQAKSLSLADITSEGYAEAIADFRAVMGENPAPILAKSCIDPDGLEPEEMVVLHAYFNSKIAQVSRLRVLEMVAEFGVPWQVVAQQQLNAVLVSEPGKKWFEQYIKADPELYAIGSNILEQGIDCADSMDWNLVLDD